MKKEKNSKKISFKEKMIMKTFNPIIEKLLTTTFDLQKDNLLFDDYYLYQKAVLERLKGE